MVQRIIENRQFFGSFKSFDDFIDRVDISIEQLSILLKINTFRFTSFDKHHLLWKAHFKLNNSKTKSEQSVLFRPAHKDFDLPEFKFDFLVEAYDQMGLLGFPFCSHFDLLKNNLKPASKAKDLKNHVGENIYIYGNLITAKRVSTVNNKYMYFGTFFDEENDIFDTVSFPTVAEKYPLRSKGIFLCYGSIADEFGYLTLNLKWISREETAGDPRRVERHKVLK